MHARVDGDGAGLPGLEREGGRHPQHVNSFKPVMEPSLRGSNGRQ